VIAIYPISFGYEFLGLLHILCAVVAFGPLFVYPTLRKAGATASVAKLHMNVAFPALTLLWVFGMGLAGMSDDVFKMSQTWLAVAIVIWALLMAVSWFLIKPSLTDQSEDATKKLSAGIGMTHLGLIVSLALMIWKPGSGL
jgi:uncharacterized membrane protein